MTNYIKRPTEWLSVICPNCNRIIGYDDDSYKEIKAAKCPYCKRWFYMDDAKKEIVTIDVPDYGQFSSDKV